MPRVAPVTNAERPSRGRAVILRHPDRAELLRLGPLVEKHERFPERTNVQLMQVDGPNEITVGVFSRRGGPERPDLGDAGQARRALRGRLGLPRRALGAADRHGVLFPLAREAGSSSRLGSVTCARTCIRGAATVMQNEISSRNLVHRV